MFIKNDSSFEKQYYNGKIGTITHITKDSIFVQCKDDDFQIEVKPETWENVSYTIDEETKAISEKTEGSFTQIPLCLALQNLDKHEVLDGDSIKKYLHENPTLLKSIIENEIAEDDLISLGYRKKQLDKFKKLLDSSDIQESDWQRFFEKNTWIFGYGLSYIFQTSLDDKKIEQVVHGYDFNSIGKRVDGLLKTAGMINSLCFVEIKTHKTNLLDKKPYRKGCWAISNELSGAVSQIQNTVSLATKSIYDKIDIKDNNGNLTGEEIFNFHPKSFLIVGKLDEFTNKYGVNTDQYRSFELFRRNIFSPEIITFDELYERSKYIVSQNDKSMGENNA